MITQLGTFYQAKQREFVRFFKFVVVGTIGAVVDWVVYNLLIRFVQLVTASRQYSKRCPSGTK